MAKVLYLILVVLTLIWISPFNNGALGTPVFHSIQPTESHSDVGGADQQHAPKFENSLEQDLSARIVEDTNLSDNQDGYEEEEEEVDCPPGKFYNIRGMRCVPIKCVGGNRFRDKETGECLIRKSFAQFSNSGGEKSLSRYNP